MDKLLSIVCLSLITGIQEVRGYCALVGANPGFNAPPQVEQVDMTRVLVSWHGIVTRKDCADQFLVKSWEYNDPNQYQISNLLPTDRSSIVIEDLRPQIEYVFQVVAREDKGYLGKDWNKSPPVRFIIRRNNPTVPPPSQLANYPVPETHSEQVSSSSSDNTPPKEMSIPRSVEEESGNKNPASLIIIVFISSTIVIITIIVAGAIYNLIKMAHKKRRGSDSGSSSSSSLDLDITNENLVSWRQSRRDLMESTRALAMQSKQSKERVSVASSVVDLTAKASSYRKVSRIDQDLEAASRGSSGAEAAGRGSLEATSRGSSGLDELDGRNKSRATSSERRSQGTQTPKALSRTPCCECSKSPLMDRRTAAKLSGESTPILAASSSPTPAAVGGSSFDAASVHNIEFIDGIYATVGKASALERISDHTEYTDSDVNNDS